MTKYYVETGPEGGQFVRVKRSSSHHHHHHRPRDCGEERLCHRHANCMHVSIDEWNDLVRAERGWRREYDALKGSLDGSMARAEKEVREARRARREADWLRREVERLQRDNDCLVVAAREGRRLGRDWQEKYDMARGVIDEKTWALQGQYDQNAMKSRLLARHRIVC